MRLEWVVLQEKSFPLCAAQLLPALVDMITTGVGALRDS